MTTLQQKSSTTQQICVFLKVGIMCTGQMEASYVCSHHMYVQCIKQSTKTNLTV